MRTSKLFEAKKLKIFENYDVSTVSTDKGGEQYCGHFAEKGKEGSTFFAILCGRVLWTAAY